MRCGPAVAARPYGRGPCQTPRITPAPQTTTYRLLAGEPLEVSHDGLPIALIRGQPVRQKTQQLPTRASPTQPYGRTPIRRGGHD